MITVWQFDSLEKEGYRFNDLVTKRFCFVDKKFAKNENEALEFLIAAYKFIPKVDSSEEPIEKFEYVGNLSVVINDSVDVQKRIRNFTNAKIKGNDKDFISYLYELLRRDEVRLLGSRDALIGFHDSDIEMNRKIQAEIEKYVRD